MPDDTRKQPPQISAERLMQMVGKEAVTVTAEGTTRGTPGPGPDPVGPRTSVDTRSTDDRVPDLDPDHVDQAEADDDHPEPSPPKVPEPISPYPPFGRPSRPLTTEEILGISSPGPRMRLDPPGVTPGTAMPELPAEVKIDARRRIDDALSKEIGKPEPKGSDVRKKAEHALAHIMRDHPGTRLLHVRLMWRDPITGEYRNKGRRKNVSANEIRDPESLCEPYGGDWIMGYMPADQGKLFDDPKAWYWFEFDRDGPEPPREWTIDQPATPNIYIDVDGVGAVPIGDVLNALRNGVAAGLKLVVETLNLDNRR